MEHTETGAANLLFSMLSETLIIVALAYVFIVPEGGGQPLAWSWNLMALIGAVLLGRGLLEFVPVHRRRVRVRVEGRTLSVKQYTVGAVDGSRYGYVYRTEVEYQVNGVPQRKTLRLKHPPADTMVLFAHRRRPGSLVVGDGCTSYAPVLRAVICGVLLLLPTVLLATLRS